MQPAPSKSTAALWMMGWLSLMLTVAIAGRQVGREINVFQLMEVRSVLGFAMIYPLIHRMGGLRAMRTARLELHLVRNLVHYLAQLGWFFSLLLIPLSQLVSLEFTMPIWTAVLAASFLGERLTTRKVVAIGFGILGVVIIVRPNAAAVDVGQLTALAAAVGFAISVIAVKALTRTEPVLVILFWMLVIQSVIGLVPAIEVWQWPSTQGWGWLLVVAFGGTFSHYCMARAMQYADATVVVPMDFLRVPLTAGAGWLIYSEQLDGYSVLGAALILGGNLLNLKTVPPGSRAVQA
jgi:drug/metabolite transporter (DMT)-like permease